MSDCPCSGNSSVGVTWPTRIPGVTAVLMYFVSPADNWNVTAFSTSVAVVTAYFPGGRSTKENRRAQTCRQLHCSSESRAE